MYINSSSILVGRTILSLQSRGLSAYVPGYILTLQKLDDMSNYRKTLSITTEYILDIHKQKSFTIKG